MKLKLRYKGGPGSGFHGHSGRPGKVGGSSSVAVLHRTTANAAESIRKYGFSLDYFGKAGGLGVLEEPAGIFVSEAGEEIDFTSEVNKRSELSNLTEVIEAEIPADRILHTTSRELRQEFTSFRRDYTKNYFHLSEDVVDLFIDGNWRVLVAGGYDKAKFTEQYWEYTSNDFEIRLKKAFGKHFIDKGYDAVKFEEPLYHVRQIIVLDPKKIAITKELIGFKGGPGSGNFGHRGRPGMVGGSLSRSWEGFPLRSDIGEAPTSKDVPPIRDSDGNFVVYHGTTNESANSIIDSKTLKKDDIGAVGITTLPKLARSFGVQKGDPVVLEIVLDKDWIAKQKIRHEVGGAGHSSFLIKSEIPSSAIIDIRIYEYSNIAEKQHDTVIVAFDFVNEYELVVAQQEFAYLGKPSVPMHMTLLFLGDVDKVDVEDVKAKVAKFAKQMAPISGVVNGIAKFSNEEDALVLLFDSAELPGFRQELRNVFSDAEQNHGFTPHITLVYGEDLKIPYFKPNIHLTIDKIYVYAGDDKFAYDLEGTTVFKGGPGSGHFGHAGRPGKVGGSTSVTSTPEFKKWFGNSKVVDADGNPLRVYHGTTADFTEFDANKLGEKSVHPSHSLGYYFAEDSDVASSFAGIKDGANIMPVYLKMENPYELSAEAFADMLDYWKGTKGGNKQANDRYWASVEYFESMQQELISKGYDGIIIRSGDYRKTKGNSDSDSVYPELYSDNYVVFWIENNNQIKSATGNSGAFDPDNPDITKEYALKQLPIDDDSKSNLIEIRKELFNEEVDTLAESMYTGEISIGQWEESMKKLIRELHSSVAAIGKGGWGEMTWADWGRLGPEVRKQYQYLHGFAQHIADNRDTISIDAIKARAHMYANAAGHSAYMIQAGQVLTDRLPWMPRDGSTKCLVNCQCEWLLDIVGREGDFNIVQATWKLNPAEHCVDCIERDGYVHMLKVYKDIIIPKSIGGY